MKKQKLQTKLTLKKQTIVSLNNNDMRNVKGGYPLTTKPDDSDNTLPTCSRPCYEPSVVFC